MRTLRPSLFFLLAILAVGLLVRTHQLTAVGLWQDERTSALAARGLLYEIPVEATTPTFTSEIYLEKDTYSDLVAAALWGEGGNTVFYLTVVRGWTTIFGLSDTALRLMQVVLGLGVILLLYLFVHRLLGEQRWALLAAALAAAHPLLIQYSIELRSYDLASFMTLLGSYLFVLIYIRSAGSLNVRRRTLLLLAYALVGFLSLMTHYFTLFVYGAHVIYVLVYHRNGRDLLAYGLAVAAVFGCFGLWMGPGGGSKGLEVINHRNQRWTEVMEQTKDDAENSIIRPANFRYVAGGLTQSMTSLSGVGFQGRGWRIRQFFPLLLLPFSLIALALLSSSTPLRIRVFLGSLFLILPLMYVVMAFRAGHTMSFNPTYNMLNVSFVVALLAVGARAADQMPRGWKRSLLLLVVLVHTGVMYFSAHPRETHFMTGPNPYQQAADAVQEAWHPGEVVVWADWYTAQLANFYLRDRADIPQKINATATQQVFLEDQQGQRKSIFQITDNWHRLPAGE